MVSGRIHSISAFSPSRSGKYALSAAAAGISPPHASGTDAQISPACTTCSFRTCANSSSMIRIVSFHMSGAFSTTVISCIPPRSAPPTRHRPAAFVYPVLMPLPPGSSVSSLFLFFIARS